eukprot:TRINITY_DN90483_c0_g1_i1.p1 TRINITY_DN90483_c0_g1~~TRINITY_DN90483_c0_g1_i1.p1  ORF type:complete len:247 (-),score=67.39 TRINITY_DN90483_c0_g1_i1:25-765(-)
MDRYTRSWVATTLVLCWTKLAEATAPGALKLDNFTFTKVTSQPGWSFLVKFDQSYAYGEKEDEFKLLCKHAYEAPKLLIAEVPVQEYGDKENDDLRQTFKLTKDDFPAYFLIDEAHPQPGLRYSGSIKADLLANWLRKHNIKIPSIGTLEEFDALAKEFLQQGSSDSVLEKAKALAEGQFSADRKAGIYIKIMQKIKEKGEDYVDSEIKRVSKIAEGKIGADKKAELEDKLKILGVFAEKPGKEEL